MHALLRDVGAEEEEEEESLFKEEVQKVAVRVGSRICTPRDTGAAPACRLRQAPVAIHAAAYSV